MSGWMLWRLKSEVFLKAAPSMAFLGRKARGAFLFILFTLIKFYFYPFDALTFFIFS